MTATDAFGGPCKCRCHGQVGEPKPRPGCGHNSGIHDEHCDQTWYEPEDEEADDDAE